MSVITKPSPLPKEYISNLRYTPSDKLKPVDAVFFFDALSAEYKMDNVGKTLKWIEGQSDTTFKGITTFKERLSSAIKKDGTINVADQKYVEDLTRRVAAGRLKTILTKTK